MKTIFYSIIATLCVVSSAYIGVALAGTIEPPYEDMGGWGPGLLPTLLGMLGMWCFVLASKSLSR